MERADRTRSVHVLLLDNLADWEAGYAMVGINQPQFQVEPGRYTIRTVGITEKPVKSMGGITAVPDMLLEDLLPGDSAMLILPGGMAWDDGPQPDAEAKAAEFLTAGVPVAAICGATLGLARAGLLNDRRHTSNAREYLAAAPTYSGTERYVDAPAVRDGDLITAAATAPVDFARQIFERLELYSAPVLEAWYALYTTGDASAFYRLMAESETVEPA